MRIVKSFIIVITVLAFVSCNQTTVAKKELTSEIDSVSYAVGLSMANQIRGNFEDIDQDLFVQGFKNGIDSTNILMDNQQIGLILNSFFRKRQEEKQLAQFAELKKAGEDFLAENATKEGVKTTASGLQYSVIKEGSGAKPEPTSKLKLHYHGTSTDGKVFDSSVDKGKPVELLANQFVKGFTEGLLLMNAGSKYKFFIPSELAYGANPRPGGPIRPYEALVFEVEILEILE